MINLFRDNKASRVFCRRYECLMKEKDDCLKALNLATAKVYQTADQRCSIILEQLISEFDQHVVEIKNAKSEIETLELEVSTSSAPSPLPLPPLPDIPPSPNLLPCRKARASCHPRRVVK